MSAAELSADLHERAARLAGGIDGLRRGLSVAIAALTVVAIAPATASAHTATGSASCTAGSVRFDEFPARLTLVGADVLVDGQPSGRPVLGTIAARSATLTIPLELAPGPHVVELFAMWRSPSQNRARHQVGRSVVDCPVPPPPPPPPPVEPPPPPVAEPVPPATTPAVVPPPPAIAPAPPAIAPPPPPPARRVVRSRPPVRTCPAGARWRARPAIARRAVQVGRRWYIAGCQPVVGQREPGDPAEVTG